jgi:hypothetical protein
LLDEEVLAYFWHGVGRAIYFSPTYFLPFGRSPWRAVEMVHGEAPHELGRLNATAGLAWAVTLVNMRRPQVMEALVRQHAGEFAREDAFRYGIAASIAMRYDTTPGQDFLAKFYLYQPPDPVVAGEWEVLVRRPSMDMLQKVYPALKEAGQLGKLFRYQPPAGSGERPAPQQP